MKLQKTLFVLIILVASFQICFSQDQSKAQKVDEFGNNGCEDFLARINNFYIELQNEPNSQGYVVITGETDYLRRKLAYELWINGAVESWKYDSSRIIKVRGKEAGDLNIQFWKVPAGAEKPDFNETKWNFIFPPQTNPFVFHDSYEQICSSSSFEKVFAEYLAANPESRGHIVIYAKSLKAYEKEKKETHNLLSSIPQNRLKYFYVKSNNSNIEFWLVPNKKNN